MISKFASANDSIIPRFLKLTVVEKKDENKRLALFSKERSELCWKPSWMEQDKSIDDIFEYGKTYEILWVYAVWDLYSMIAIPKRCWGIATHFSKLLELAQKTNWPFTLSAVVVKRTSLGQSATLLPQRIPEENQFEPQCIRPHERTAESAQSASAVPCGQISNPFLFDAKSFHG